ncbi:glucose-repressible protein [Mrakia frigida]|uniref:glucose-repressible protein n=1 Tax=Mrakia frigida TaxID=29902 RepID=UPI003FCC153F
MDTVKSAVNYVSETVQGLGAEASKEGNKEVAKDSNASIGTRFDAATSAVGDKVDQHGHEADASLQKEKVKH